DRVLLRVGVRLARRAEDEDRRRLLRADPRRHLLLGRTDGGRHRRLATHRDRLRVLPRLLRPGPAGGSRQVRTSAMRQVSRRQFLRVTAGGAAGAMALGQAPAPAQTRELTFLTVPSFLPETDKEPNPPFQEWGTQHHL